MPHEKNKKQQGQLRPGWCKLAERWEAMAASAAGKPTRISGQPAPMQRGVGVRRQKRMESKISVSQCLPVGSQGERHAKRLRVPANRCPMAMHPTMHQESTEKTKEAKKVPERYSSIRGQASSCARRKNSREHVQLQKHHGRSRLQNRSAFNVTGKAR